MFLFALIIRFVFIFLVSRSIGSCSSSVCRLLEDGGSGDKTPPPCWCTAETAVVAAGDPHNRTTTGYRCPPRGSLPLHRRGGLAVTAVGGRPSRSRPATAAAVQSNVQRPSSCIVSPRCVSAGDWCCDNENVDDDDDYEDEDDNYYYDDYDGNRVVNDEIRDVDNNRVRVVVMNNGTTGLITDCGMTVDAQGRGSGCGTDTKPPVAQVVTASAAERTYASTEAQTDETACSSTYREQRRRERRERRQQQRRVHPPPPPPPALSSSSLLPSSPQQQSGVATALAAVPVDPDRLPDLLLNSHLPPPLYTTVSGGGVCDVAMAARAANLQASLLPGSFQHAGHHQASGAPVGSSPAVNSPGGFRLPFGIIPARRRRSVFVIFLY